MPQLHALPSTRPQAERAHSRRTRTCRGRLLLATASDRTALVGSRTSPGVGAWRAIGRPSSWAAAARNALELPSADVSRRVLKSRAPLARAASYFRRFDVPLA